HLREPGGARERRLEDPPHGSRLRLARRLPERLGGDRSGRQFALCPATRGRRQIPARRAAARRDLRAVPGSRADGLPFRQSGQRAPSRHLSRLVRRTAPGGNGVSPPCTNPTIPAPVLPLPAAAPSPHRRSAARRTPASTT